MNTYLNFAGFTLQYFSNKVFNYGTKLFWTAIAKSQSSFKRFTTSTTNPLLKLKCFIFLAKKSE